MSKYESKADKQFVKMTETPVKKLILSLAVPTIISMLITTIYNMADTYFVSKINVSASGATGIVFGLMAVLQAFGFMFGQGSGSNVSRRLGAKDLENAKRYSSTAFFLAVAVGVIVLVLGLIFIEPLMKFMGSTKTILPYAKTYGTYILIAGPAMVGSCVLNNILRYEGLAKLAMIGLTTGGLLNIALDPLLIFVFDMGIAGAGLATAISQYTSLGILMSMFLFKKCQCTINPRFISLKPRLVWDIISTGVPSFCRQGLSSVSTMILNSSAAVYGDACIAAMSIIGKCGFLMFSICVGIGQGFQPVCGYNYGSKRYDRVREGILFVWQFSTLIIAVLSVGTFIFSPQLVSLFRDEAEVVDVGKVALRYLCVSLVFLPTVMTANMTFQSIGKTVRAFLLACSQNGIFFIPLILLLPKYFGLMGIELAQPIAYVLAALTAVPFLLIFSRQLKTQGNKTS